MVFSGYVALQFVMKGNSNVKRVACVSPDMFVMAAGTVQTPVMKIHQNVVRLDSFSGHNHVHLMPLM